MKSLLHHWKFVHLRWMQNLVSTPDTTAYNLGAISFISSHRQTGLDKRRCLKSVIFFIKIKEDFSVRKKDF